MSSTESDSTYDYEVAITYCDGVVFTHGHESPKEAVTEYAQLLSHALEPIAEEPRHIRLITFLRYDEFKQVSRIIDSGIFPCEHAGEDDEVEVATATTADVPEGEPAEEAEPEPVEETK